MIERERHRVRVGRHVVGGIRLAHDDSVRATHINGEGIAVIAGHPVVAAIDRIVPMGTGLQSADAHGAVVGDAVAVKAGVVDQRQRRGRCGAAITNEAEVGRRVGSVACDIGLADLDVVEPFVGERNAGAGACGPIGAVIDRILPACACFEADIDSAVRCDAIANRAGVVGQDERRCIRCRRVPDDVQRGIGRHIAGGIGLANAHIVGAVCD